MFTRNISTPRKIGNSKKVYIKCFQFENSSSYFFKKTFSWNQEESALYIAFQEEATHIMESWFCFLRQKHLNKPMKSSWFSILTIWELTFETVRTVLRTILSWVYYPHICNFIFLIVLSEEWQKKNSISIPFLVFSLASGSCRDNPLELQQTQKDS